MAQITGQAASQLRNQLLAYLEQNSPNLSSEEITNVLNEYLSGGDKVTAQGGGITNGIYKRFLEFDKITNKVEVVTTGLWSGDTGSLTSFFSQSTQTALDYYVNVYDKNPSIDATGTVQYAIAYGHKHGSGSVSLANNDNSFTFASSSGTFDSDEIYVINVKRSRYREKMDAGNWSLKLSGSANSDTVLIDDSGKKFSDSVGKAGRVFNVVSGSLNLGSQSEATVSANFDAGAVGKSFGLFYPDQGLIVLNPTAIHTAIGTSKNATDVGGKTLSYAVNAEQRNHFLLHNAIKGGADFEARRTENVSTSHYFVRATNREYNFSNNPTFTKGTDGTFSESTFERDPKTFITTVGLYNDANEMIAVAKTSKPIAKSFDKEVLIKVKLDF